MLLHWAEASGCVQEATLGGYRLDENSMTSQGIPWVKVAIARRRFGMMRVGSEIESWD